MRAGVPCRSVRAVGRAAVVALAWLPAAIAVPTSDADLSARYARAESLLPWHIADLLQGVPGGIQWSEDGRRVRYTVRTGNGPVVVEVVADSGARSIAEPSAADPPAHDADLAVAPNGRWALRMRDGNLYRVDLPGGAETTLTRDGEPNYAYAGTPDSDLYSITRRRQGVRPAPVGVWSPDSSRFLTYRMDQRRVRTIPWVQAIVPGAEHQVPVLHQAHVALPGDEFVTTAEFMVIDVEGAPPVRLDVPPGILADSDPAPVTNLRWSGDGQRVFVLHEARGYRTLSYFTADPRTGKSRLLVTESAALPLRNPSGETSRSNYIAWPLAETEELVFYSERDDRAQYYLYDTSTGRLVNQITRGERIVHDVAYIDERSRWLYFLAGDLAPDRDPYFSRLYRVHLDGSGLELLTPEDAHHEISFAPDGRHFLDTYSTVDRAPVTLLRAADGRLVATLERGDARRLEAAGWRAPERFRVLSADGRTPLYGVLYRPSDLDPARRYPVLEAVYYGSHTAKAPWSFGINTSYDAFLAQPTAELGFVVMVFDARGSNFRGQAFQDFSFGTGFGREDILADHIAALRQLAARYPYLDLDRVGIYGHSWGGYRAARAMFQFPDFYKVGVAASGSHDNYLYVNSHEMWFGMPPEADEAYRLQSNLRLADRLKGKLLLVHGEIDDTVHPANTFQLADALVRANKDFDLLILPNRNHDIWDDPYFIRRRWDYFVRNLMGKEPPAGFVVHGPAQN
jgi:dipeptidyl-peptidase 4